MGEEQLDKLADKIAERIKHDVHQCSAFTDEERAAMKRLIARLDAVEKNTIATLVKIIIGGGAVLLGVGIVSYIKQKIGL